MLTRLIRLSNACQLCGLDTARTLPLCLFCEQDMPWNDHSCTQCGIPLPSGEDHCCGACLKKIWSFDRCIAPLKYDHEVRLLIATLKFHQQLINAKILGHLFAIKIQDYYLDNMQPEVIIPTPLHHWRTRKRGFNQALEISKTVSSLINIPLLKGYCIRQKRTQPQSALRKQARKKNLKNAFTLKKPIPFDHVAIVDDVFTTGTTVEALAHRLKQHGISLVDVWCMARAY